MSDLPNKLPQGTPFQKLRGQGEPYCCSKWKYDRQGVFCIYFKFPPHEKRIPLSEIEVATGYLNREKVFDRKAFKDICPISSKGNPCGFTVIGRILEKTSNTEYTGSKGFILRK